VKSPVVSGAAPGSGLASALGVRLREIRQGAGLSLVETAHVMGRKPSYYSQLSRLEHGRFKYPSLMLVADYLRTCRASFADLVPMLSEYTNQPPVRESRVREQVLAELAPLGGPEAVRLDVYDMKTAEAGRRDGRPLKSEARVRAARKQAKAAAERRLLDRMMRDEVNRLGVKPTFVVRKAAYDYARMVWRALQLTTASQKAEARTVHAEGGKKRGRPRKTREQRLAEAQARIRQLAPGTLTVKALEQIQDKVVLLFEDVHRWEKKEE